MTEVFDGQEESKNVFREVFGSFLNFVETLAGDDCNLRVRVEALKLNLDGTRVVVDGDVNIDLVDAEEVTS